MDSADKIKVINDLGEWLCKDIEKEVVGRSLPCTDIGPKFAMIRDIAERIQWYRDNFEDI